MMFFYHIPPTTAIWILPLLLLLAIMTSLGVGLWLSALNVEYRDVSQAINFIVQIWLFATPIAYPITMIPEKWRTLYGLNPMVGVVEGFRWALLGKANPSGEMLLASFSVVILIFLGGIFYFRRMEKTFADIV